MSYKDASRLHVDIRGYQVFPMVHKKLDQLGLAYDEDFLRLPGDTPQADEGQLTSWLLSDGTEIQRSKDEGEVCVVTERRIEFGYSRRLFTK